MSPKVWLWVPIATCTLQDNSAWYCRMHSPRQRDDAFIAVGLPHRVCFSDARSGRSKAREAQMPSRCFSKSHVSLAIVRRKLDFPDTNITYFRRATCFNFGNLIGENPGTNFFFARVYACHGCDRKLISFHWDVFLGLWTTKRRDAAAWIR